MLIRANQLLMVAFTFTRDMDEYNGQFHFSLYAMITALIATCKLVQKLLIGLLSINSLLGKGTKACSSFLKEVNQFFLLAENGYFD